MSVGCVARMQKQHLAPQPRHWSATSAEAWKTQVSDHSPRRQTIDPNDQGQAFIPAHCMRVEMMSRFRRKLSVRSIANSLVAAGYPSRRPTRSARLVSGHWRRRRVCVLERTQGDAPGNGGTVSLMMSLASRCFTMTVVLVCAIGKGRDW